LWCSDGAENTIQRRHEDTGGNISVRREGFFISGHKDLLLDVMCSSLCHQLTSLNNVIFSLSRIYDIWVVQFCIHLKWRAESLRDVKEELCVKIASSLLRIRTRGLNFCVYLLYEWKTRRGNSVCKGAQALVTEEDVRFCVIQWQ